MFPIQQEIHRQLMLDSQTDKPSKFKDLKKYIGTSLDFIGLSVPRQRKIFKQGFSFGKLPVAQQLEIWDKIWRTSGHYEMMNFAQIFVSRHLASFEPVIIWETVKNWVMQVDNWAHSDGLSSIYARLLEQLPEVVYAQYQVWNISKNPWERRQSIVGIMCYSSVRKSHLSFEKTLGMTSTLLNDEDYYVQKGIGWTLREMGNVYPDETLAFLMEHVISIRPAAFTAAIEKLDSAVKDQLKAIRKDHKIAAKAK